MPDDLREAHRQNDEVVERTYFGRQMKNDTERLEKLFQMYRKAVARWTGFAHDTTLGTTTLS